MKIIHRLILTLFSLFFAVFSLFLALIPFNFIGIFSVNNTMALVENMENNYYYTLLGIIVFIASIILLLYSLTGSKKNLEGSFLAMRNEYGEIIIYSHTIVGIVQNVVDKFSGISNIKTSVTLTEGKIIVEMKGDVSAEINIPEVSKELQALVKDHIEKATGATVKELNINIYNVTPIRALR
ncbi:alkaline shock response membrane anchor protein AmaP [Tissierella sp.]|uniref:alkaline shock response membrane anchor protein AmaP n=1 Tax=Tissierella sp. TaxID=41274 RepID=UPI00285FB5F6|nr:alkaline shock response membrane anchor protein AmaP [Tissierella sp.]MDR7856147.1 alkaline shock response membrane anchor protein AmaP [Tissierella sp.]